MAVLFFYFSCGIGAVLLPMAIDYYHFSDSLNLLSKMASIRPKY